MEKKITKDKLLDDYLTLGNMNDSTSIANPRARIISNEITSITAKIYERRKLNMVDLSQKKC